MSFRGVRIVAASSIALVETTCATLGNRRCWIDQAPEAKELTLMIHAMITLSNSSDKTMPLRLVVHDILSTWHI